jgi:hypothetical protein
MPVGVEVKGDPTQKGRERSDFILERTQLAQRAGRRASSMTYE